MAEDRQIVKWAYQVAMSLTIDDGFEGHKEAHGITDDEAIFRLAREAGITELFTPQFAALMVASMLSRYAFEYDFFTDLLTT